MGTLALPTIGARGTQPPDWKQIVALDGNQDDWDPSEIGKDLGGVLATVTTSGGIDLTGIIAPNITRPDGTSLFELTLIGSSEKVTIKTEDVASSAANRIVSPIAGGFDTIIYPGQVARFVYFLPLARWLILSIDYPVAQVGFSTRVDFTTSPVEINTDSHGGLVTNKGRTGAQIISLPNGPFHNFEVTIQRTERGAGETLALKPEGSDVINHPSGDITSAGTIDFAPGEALTLVYDKVNLTWNIRGDSRLIGGGGGGAWEKVSKITLGADTNPVDITGIDSTAQTWEIRFRLRMAIAATFALRVRAGGVFKTGFEYLFHVAKLKHTSASYAAVASIGTEDRIKVSDLVAGATVARSVQGTIRIYDPGNTVTRKQVKVDVGFWDSSNAFASVIGWGVWDSGNDAVDAIRFFSTQDFAAGSEFALFKRTDFT